MKGMKTSFHLKVFIMSCSLSNYRSSHQRCSIKKVFLEISQDSQENTCARVSFLIKLQACNFIKKETLAQEFSCESCEISKNTFFVEHILEISQDSQENTCARVSFLIKLQARPATLLKKRLWRRCFPVNFAKFLRTLFYRTPLVVVINLKRPYSDGYSDPRL